MIKQASKTNTSKLSILILDAIHNIANTLTGEDKKSKILETLDKYIAMEINRLSYKNIWIYEKENQQQIYADLSDCNYCHGNLCHGAFL